jgi:hypothetical protein
VSQTCGQGPGGLTGSREAWMENLQDGAAALQNLEGVEHFGWSTEAAQAGDDQLIALPQKGQDGPQA